MSNLAVTKLKKDPISYIKDVKIPELAELLATLSDAYYNSSKPLVTDAIFDLLLEALKERDPDNPQLKKIRAPPSKYKVKLPCYMPSLDKIKPDTPELQKWINKYKGPYVLSDKLDGATGLLHKKNKKLFLYSNGDEGYGQNITHLIPHILSKINLESLDEGICIRGELIISKENFAKLNNKYKNGRNAVAGLINSKNYSVNLANLTSFVTYNIIGNNQPPLEQLKILQELNFDVVDYKLVKKLTEKLLSDYLVDRRNSSRYELDGIVVADNASHEEVTKKNPDYSFAFKQILDEQVATTKVIKVNWEVSRHGYLKPTIDVEPVNLVGVTIKHATAFNAKYVKEKVLGPGSVIKIVRSGDVIPHILEVVKPSSSGKPQMPTGKYTWDDTQTNISIILDDKNLDTSIKDTMTTKLIADFFKKLGVKHISDGIVLKLVEAKFDNIFKIVDTLSHSPEDLYSISGLGETIITKIRTNTLEALQDTNLAVLMTASNTLGRGVSLVKIKVILESYPDILTKKYTEEKLAAMLLDLPGFDTKTATLVSSNFDKFKIFFDKLNNIIDLKYLKVYKLVKVKKNKVTGLAKLANITVVFSGFRDKELEDFIVNNGGKVTGSVSSNTSILLYNAGEKSTGKYTKAVELGIDVLTKEEFEEKYK